MLVEQVAGSPWNGWPDAHGIRGRITVVHAAGALKKKLGLTITSEKDENRGRVYAIR